MLALRRGCFWIARYLDQNKWIDLAKAIYRPDAKAMERENAEKLKRAVDEGRLRCPVERNSPDGGVQDRRLHMASVFAAFSAGWFIAIRQARVSSELDAALTKLLTASNTVDEQPFNAFAQTFLWAFGDNTHLSALISIPAEHLDELSSAVGRIDALLSYVGLNDENVRRMAVVRMQASNMDLTDSIRRRRALTECEPADMRFRLLSAAASGSPGQD